MQIRRVVTGLDDNGVARFVRDELVEFAPITSGTEVCRLWGSDVTPEVPNAGAGDAPASSYPTVGGYRFSVFTKPPEPESDRTDGSVGQHATNTVDFAYVIAGTPSMWLDSGDVIQLNRGDTLIINGVLHAWHNWGTEPATVLVGIVGATGDVQTVT